MKVKYNSRTFEENLRVKLDGSDSMKQIGKSKKILFNKNSIRKQLKANSKYCPLFNLIFFGLILILLPKAKLSKEHYIELKVDGTGYQEIISEKYGGIKPSAIYVNKEVQILRDRKVYVQSEGHIIKIE